MRSLQNEEVFKDYFLVRGTALALQLGHWKSIDIAAMKLHAIETSGNRAKDFMDIFCLLREMPLK